MLIRQDDGFHHPVASEITPAQVYAKRRDFLQQLAAAGCWPALAVPGRNRPCRAPASSRH